MVVSDHGFPLRPILQQTLAEYRLAFSVISFVFSFSSAACPDGVEADYTRPALAVGVSDLLLNGIMSWVGQPWERDGKRHTRRGRWRERGNVWGGFRDVSAET